MVKYIPYKQLFIYQTVDKAPSCEGAFLVS